MSKPGPAKKAVPSVNWNIAIDGDIAREVEILLADPLRGCTRKGERGKLVTRLLSEWIKDVKAKGTLPSAEDA